MHSKHRMIRLMLHALFLGSLGVAFCACSHGGPKPKVASKKRVVPNDDNSFGLYTPSTVNNSILRRGQKTMGTAALGSF